jgi:uncharacterized protein (TIGR04255 family)
MEDAVGGSSAEALSEQDIPLDGLPAADPVLLANAPLELAIAEVRFVDAGRDITVDDALAIQRAVAAAGWALDRFEPATQQTLQLTVSPTGAAPQVQEQARGWRYFTADDSTQLTVLPGLVAVQTSAYERWSVSLRPLLAGVLRGLEASVTPTLVQRIGLRYIDRFVDRAADQPTAWLGRLSDALLGPLADSVIGPRLASAQQQLEIRLGAEHGALLRHGPFRDGAAAGKVSYLLDIDVFDTRTAAFEPDAVIQRAERLNRTALALFQTAVTAEYLAELRGGEQA